MGGRKLQDPETRKRLRTLEDSRRERENIRALKELQERREEEERLRKQRDEIKKMIEREVSHDRKSRSWEDSHDPAKDIEDFRETLKREYGVIFSDNTGS